MRVNFRLVHLPTQLTSRASNLVLDRSNASFAVRWTALGQSAGVGRCCLGSAASLAEFEGTRSMVQEWMEQHEIKKPPRRGALKSRSYSKVRLGTFGFRHVKQGLLPFRDLLVDSELASLRLVGKFEHDVEHDFFHD